MDIQAVAEELRRLQSERAAALKAVSSGHRGGARKWLAAAIKYDRALISAAATLGVTTPRQPRIGRLLGTHVRLALEADLEAAGLELGCEIAA